VASFPDKGVSLTEKFKGIPTALMSNIMVLSAPDSNDGISCKGLWDTGSNKSALTKRLIKVLDLKASGQGYLKGITRGEAKETNTFKVSIILPNGIGFASLNVFECDKLGEADFLIGMDIITKGDFAITTKDDQTFLSFRRPSLNHIDFEREEKAENKVGRNMRCPCGSGKKFKNCCDN